MIELIFHNAMGLFWWLVFILTIPLAWVGFYWPTLVAIFWMLYHEEAQGAYLDRYDEGAAQQRRVR